MDKRNVERKIRLGWHLHQPDIPCDIPVSDVISQHTSILAQSGSGKSFLLGRILEELLLCSKAKICIFDPNGDFRFFNQSNTGKNGPWENEKIAEWFGKDEALTLLDRDRKEIFESEWSTLNFLFVNNQTDRHVEVKRPLLLFSDLPEHDQLAALRISRREDQEELMYYRNIVLELEDRSAFTPKDLKRKILGKKEDDSRKILNSKLTESKFNNKIVELSSLKIWLDKIEEYNILEELYFYKNDWDCFILDLPSIPEKEARMIIVNVFLEKIWKVALEKWETVMKNKSIVPETKDDRVPLFIVLDEAHNFFSPDKADPWTVSITEKIMRIVAEGRKYGLFLIISTQRPSKVPSEILSECENVCLLRMNSIIERDKVRDLWGIPRENIDKAAHFLNPGDCLLFGRWVPSTYAVHAAPRRTVEGGANLSKDWQMPREGRRKLSADKSKKTPEKKNNKQS